MFVNKPQDMMKEYRKASVNAELAMADPYTITKALFQGVFERLGQAKGAIARGDLEEKAKRLASASAIIQHLKDTLDPSQAPWDSIPQSAIKEAEAKMRANQKHFQHNYDPTKNLVEGAI